ncbi:MAG: glycosyltransferase family 4 protein [Gammaproteobacteria bacterium]|nr:glycosyltransferase family 4 protein [Gammaproteobacteria bacterium]
MRIGISLQSLDITWGGIGVYTDEVVRNLARIDRKNEYILIYPGFGAPRKSLGRLQRKYANVTEVETDFSRFPSGFYWDQFVVPKVAREHGIDLLFNPFLSIPIPGRFKKVMIMHAVEYHTVPRVYDWKLYAKWFFLEKALLPSADRVISISNTMTNDISRAVRYPIANVRTIYHGVSDVFHVISDEKRLAEAREEYTLPEKYILFVGHLYPQKNFATLLRAFRKICDSLPHDIVVAGRPRWKFDTDLQLIAELGLSDRIQFLNFVPNGDLPLVYNLADCFIYPSFYEAFGLAQIEAMACGCPVIGANTGAIPEVTDGAAILFDPKSVDELADKMLRLLTEPELHQEYVARGLARAKFFSWEKCARQTLEVFEEFANE